MSKFVLWIAGAIVGYSWAYEDPKEIGLGLLLTLAVTGGCRAVNRKPK